MELTSPSEWADTLRRSDFEVDVRSAISLGLALCTTYLCRIGWSVNRHVDWDPTYPAIDLDGKINKKPDISIKLYKSDQIVHVRGSGMIEVLSKYYPNCDVLAFLRPTLSSPLVLPIKSSPNLPIDCFKAVLSTLELAGIDLEEPSMVNLIQSTTGLDEMSVRRSLKGVSHKFLLDA